MLFVFLLLSQSLPSVLSGREIFARAGFPSGDEGQTAAGQPAEEKASGLLQRFQDHWGSGDVASLMSLLSERARVIMKVGFLGLDGEYGRGQADYIMKEFFNKAAGNRFSISRYRELSGGVSAYAAGNIVYRERKSGINRELLIFISLEERGGAWSIEELRISED